MISRQIWESYTQKRVETYALFAPLQWLELETMGSTDLSLLLNHAFRQTCQTKFGTYGHYMGIHLCKLDIFRHPVPAISAIPKQGLMDCPTTSCFKVGYNLIASTWCRAVQWKFALGVFGGGVGFTKCKYGKSCCPRSASGEGDAFKICSNCRLSVHLVNSRAMLGRWLPSFCVWMWYGWPPSCLGYLGRGRGLPGLEVTIRYNQQSYLSHLWVLMAFYGLWPENIGAEYVHWNLSMASKNSLNMSKPLKSGTLKTPKFTRGISHQSLQDPGSPGGIRGP